MSDRTSPKVVFWPFLLMDLVFLGLAYMIFHFSHRPWQIWEAYAIITCVALGAWSFLKPFQVKLRMAESENLITAAEEIRKIEHIAAQIGSSTSLWQSIQDQASKTAGSAKVVSEQMAKEAKSFSEFLQKANDSEKNHLRLEIEKFKAAEADWIETIVRVSDHIFALHQAATRSGQPRLVEQMTHFRNACFDVTRRVGVNVFAGTANEPFDPARHLIPDGTRPSAGAEIADTVSPGYTFRGQLLRRAGVRLKSDAATENASAQVTTESASSNEKTTTPRKEAAPVPSTGELPL